MYRHADIGRIGTHFDRETDFADQVTGVRAHDCAANDTFGFLVP